MAKTNEPASATETDRGKWTKPGEVPSHLTVVRWKLTGKDFARLREAESKMPLGILPRRAISVLIQTGNLPLGQAGVMLPDPRPGHGTRRYVPGYTIGYKLREMGYLFHMARNLQSAWQLVVVKERQKT